MLKTRTRIALLAAFTAAVSGLAACGGSSGSSTTSSSNVLKVWWYEAPGSAYQIAWDQAVKDFKKAHPGVTVQFSLKTFNQMQQSAS
jgi:raffinose/stachyose/melibiose transport system substrate-binding protein